MNHLTVPDNPHSPHHRRLDLDVPRMWNELRKKSISELSLVMDMFRGPSPSSSQHLHPDRERACQSTGNLPTSPKGRRRRRMQRTWKALSAHNIARQYVIGELFVPFLFIPAGQPLLATPRFPFCNRLPPTKRTSFCVDKSPFSGGDALMQINFLPFLEFFLVLVAAVLTTS
ncbi:hypothetical protein Aduo_004972 [Ancylostoma duodenale]